MTMKTSLSFYSILRQCRPMRCPSQGPHTPFSVYTRPPYINPFRPSRPQIGRAAFTTSPTTIPPQSEDSPSTSSASSSTPLAIPVDSQEQPSEPIKPPSYQLTFTCKPCQERSSHEVSKQGYHYGTVLITCQSCKNRHVISDHLKVSPRYTRAMEHPLGDGVIGKIRLR